jgi:ferredoxin
VQAGATVGRQSVRIRIDGSRCQGHGRCELIAPRYFVVDDSGVGRVLMEEVAAADESDVDEAEFCCPEKAIELER